MGIIAGAARMMILLMAGILLTASADPAGCRDVRAIAWPDYTFLIGSAAFEGPEGDVETGSTYRWLLNGREFRSGKVPQLFLLHADGGTVASGGARPLDERGVAFAEGRWGSALALEPSGLLTYAREGNLDLNEGTIEMWIAPRADGGDPVYRQRDHTLFQYRAPNGESIGITQAAGSGILYAGGTVGGKWESAYGGAASMRDWRAGEWHSIVYTFSAGANLMRFYVDGVLTADTNERHYWPPASGGDRFSITGNLAGSAAHYTVDEVRISGRVMEDAEIRQNARRTEQPRHDEVWLPLAGFAVGDRLAFEFTPAYRSGAGAPCLSAEFEYRGIPLTNPNPPSTLLPPATRELSFSVKSLVPTACRYSVGRAFDYGGMTAFDQGHGTTSHQTIIRGLTPETATVNDVYIRCAAQPEYLLHLQYRSLPDANPPFPRTGNLWGSSLLAAKGLEHCARTDLFLGASFTPSQIRTLRSLNPNILILTSINTVENFGLPDDYYLKDVQGKRIEVWPGTYRLNLTKPYVAGYQARYACQRILDSGLMVDGCFFDNFMTTQSWLKTDIYGNRLQLDANEDGQEDDPRLLDAAWREGVYQELKMWRTLMPFALASGHLPRPPDPDFAAIFNGDSIGFMTSDVLEGKRPFQDLWDTYNDWWRIGRLPGITMVESTPQDQISYGYGYDPLKVIPASTLEFARTFYPNVRFGLALTLMNDGYFAHEFGDTFHGNDWRYDELDFKLGHPRRPATRVPVNGFVQSEHILNGGFEAPLDGTWQVSVNTSAGASASAARDTSTAVAGTASARITINSAGQGVDWHVDFNQRDRSLAQGIGYDLTFWARSDVARTIGLSTQKGSPDWRNYGLSRRISVGARWQWYSVAFEAKETVSDSRIQFFLGERPGVVWLDGVSVQERLPNVLRRDFTNGIVLLNGTRQAQTITPGPGFARLRGDQAPRWQYIVDDSDAAFSSTGGWKEVVHDSGEWKALGPFYHNWGRSCRQLDGTEGMARWNLSLPADDTYTIEAWWPAAPASSTWSKRVVYEVASGDAVIASTAADQTTGGDQWHVIAVVPLRVAGTPIVRMRNEGNGPAIADALHVRSASRYNDGSPAPEVTVAPMDGIILQRVSAGRR